MIERNLRTWTPWAAGWILAALGGCGSDASGPPGTAGDAGSGAVDAGGADATFADASQPGDAIAATDARTNVDGMAAIDGGIVVCAGNTTKTCADCSPCDQCPGCALTIPPGMCTGTPSFTACSQCDNQCSGCLGCTVQTTCTYFDAGVNSCAECATVTSSGCWYAACGGCDPHDGGTCTGTLTPCSAFNSPDSGPCQGQIDCYLAATGCTGTPAACSTHTRTDCAKENGCSWMTSTTKACTGTIEPCTAIDVSRCTSFPGCGLVQANPHATCDSSAAGCFACGGSADGGPSGVCAAPLSCCGATASAQSCQPQAACGNDAFQTSCDGPEDCAGGQCCASVSVSMSTSTAPAVSGTTVCASSCPVDSGSSSVYSTDSVACHSSADCLNVFDEFSVPYPACCRAPGYPVGTCVSQTFQGIFMNGGGTCN